MQINILVSDNNTQMAIGMQVLVLKREVIYLLTWESLGYRALVEPKEKSSIILGKVKTRERT